jgi:hypothetical protein
MRQKASQGTKTFSGVTTAAAPINIASVSGAQKSTRPVLQMDFGGYTVVPDPDWPGMDGGLTDMANLCRARDAAQHFADQERRQEPEAIAA